jgi:AsmA protein
MFIVQSLKWLVITLVLVITAGVLYLSFADLNWLKPQIESAMAEATGRTLKLNGNFDLNILPTPSITFEDITLSNAAWGSQPVMVEAGYFSSEFDLWSLVSAPIQLRNFLLRDVDVLLEVNGQETGNWVLGGDTATEPDEKSASGSSAGTGLPVIIEFAEVRNIKVTYRDQESERLVTSVASLDLTTDDATYTVISASGQINDKPLKLTAKMGPAQAMASGADINFNLEPTLDIYSLKANGALTILTEDFLLQGWTILFEDTQTLLDGNVGRGPDTSIELSIKATGPSLASISSELPTIPFQAAFVTRLASEKLILDPIDATFGESDISGALEGGLGNKITIGGQLQSKRLDLTPFADNEDDTRKKPARESNEGQKESKFVFIDEPLPLETLNNIDLDITSSIGQLTFQNIDLLDVTTRVELKDGNLHFTNKYTGLNGGRSASDITLTASGPSSKLDIDVRMRDMRFNLLSGDTAKSSQIPPVDITMNIESTGGSPRALAASATGRLLMTQGKGQIKNDLMDKVSGDIGTQLFSALNPFSKEEKFTMLDCTILGLETNNGNMNITGMLFQTEKIKAVGKGYIDLNKEKLNIKFNTKPREGVGITADMFVTPFVKLSGTLASPRVTLNKTGTLTAGGAAVATGGLSILAQSAADRASGEKDQCAAVLSEIGDHPPLN